MKNDDVSEIDSGQHEQLCAYVFGELQGPERAAFEAELAGSSALRAEQARLEATIGLVKSALPDDGLSIAVRRDVLASARRSRFRYVSGRRLAQLCAAAAVVLVGLAALRFVTLRVGETRAVLDGNKVARVASPERRELRTAEAELSAPSPKELEALRGLGYVGVASESAAAGAVSHSLAEEAKEAEVVQEALGYGGADPATEATARADAFQIDRGGHAPELPAEQALHFENAQLTALNAPSTPPLTAGAASLGAAAGPGSPLSRGQVNVLQVTPSSGQAQGMEGFFLGQGLQAQPSGPAGAPRGAGESLGKLGKLRGPGDSVPPAATEAPARQSLAAATPPASEARPMLDALGYGGEHDEDVPAIQDSARVQVQPLTREQVAAEVERLLAATRLAPGESPRDMFFRYFGDAPFVPAFEQPVSTFAVDVDTASYALARAYLKQGQLPPRASVRTEEFVNYFRADLAPPTDGQPFGLALELLPSPFAEDGRSELLRVGVRAKDVADSERKPVALTFVIDNSGSMREGERLELVKRSLALLLRQLYAGDSVAIVKFSNEAAVVTPALPATRRGELEALIGALPIEGGTNVEAGLRLGYQLAEASLQRNTVNRVVLCSDGVGNIGETSAQGLLALVKDARAKGVYLNTVGVGMGNHNDAFLEQLADEGDGVCNYVDSDAEAKRVFVDGLASALQPVARDVKIQVEFDPAQVESWRLLGYENRALRTQDFRNDAIDAGEVNAGHQVTALYELVRRPSRSGPLATVRLRYKPPFAIDAGQEGAAARAASEQALELERTLSASSVLAGFAAATNGTQRAVLAAQFAEVLRQSVHARGDSFATLVREAQRLEKTLGDPDFTEFVALLALANPLLDACARQETPRVQAALDELSKLRYEQALRERKLVLARQAGEPEPDADERRAVERAEQATLEAIQRLESEVRALVGDSAATTNAK